MTLSSIPHAAQEHFYISLRIGAYVSNPFNWAGLGGKFHLIGFGEGDTIWLPRIDPESQCNFHMAFCNTCLWILELPCNMSILRPICSKEAKPSREFTCMHVFWLAILAFASFHLGIVCVSESTFILFHSPANERLLDFRSIQLKPKI